MENLEPGVSYQRYEDMSPTGRLAVMIEEDGDVIVTVIPDSKAFNSFTKSAQFCTFIGGGRSPAVREAILKLAQAILQENLDNPQYRE